MDNIIKIGVTSGDLNGVGLQILIQSYSEVFKKNKNIKLILFSSKSSWEFYLKLLKINGVKYNVIDKIESAEFKTINIFECLKSNIIIKPGQVTKESGFAASQSLKTASDYLISHEIDALVTMPVNKSNMFFEKGLRFFGHTEYLRDKFKAKETLMILMAKELKIATVTNHIPISKVSDTLNKKLLTSKIELLLNSLQTDFLINSPKIAVLGLNPHMGDNGLIGKEEEEIIKPIIMKFKNEGFNVSGPFSSDAFFGKSSFNNYDAVLSMYHDQGLIPFKMKSFNQGLNYTAGMSVVRTSPDHGPAYDIVGTKAVKTESFLNAVFWADKIYKSRLV